MMRKLNRLPLMAAFFVLFSIMTTPHLSFADTTLQFQRGDLFSPAIVPNDPSVFGGYLYYSVTTSFAGTGFSTVTVVLPVDISGNSFLSLYDLDTCSYSIDNDPMQMSPMWACGFRVWHYTGSATQGSSVVYTIYGSPFNFTAGHTYGIQFQNTSGDASFYGGTANVDLIFAGGSGAPPPPTLAFPLAVSTGTTPYTAPISAVLDHSITVSSGFSYYQYEGSNGFLQAYDGESGTGSSLCRYYTSANPTVSQPCDGNSHSIIGYLKDVGADAFNLPLLNYQSEDSVYPGKELLWYEGHSGYDYPVALDTAVYPATIGTLCVASNRTAPDGNGDLWRNSTMCPYGTDTIVVPNSVNNDSWDSWHQFYIAYPSQGNNNVTYATFYMHVDDLATSVKNDVLANGYSTVTDLTQAVALSGNTAPPSRPVGYHLHFELRKVDANGPTEIDPYGDGTSGNPYLLWQTQPQ